MNVSDPKDLVSQTFDRSQYGEYKDPKIEWLGSIPKHWSTTKLKFISDIEVGNSPKSKYYNKEGDGPPFLQGNAEFGDRHPNPERFCSEPDKIADNGDLLLSVRAPVGEINTADRRYGIGRGLCRITPNSKSLDHDYAYYSLIAVRKQLNPLSSGSTFDSVSRRDVAGMRIVLPSLPEQRTIATYLDRETGRIDALIEKKEQLIDLLEEKRTALISRVVTKGLDEEVEMQDSGVEWLGEIPAHWGTAKLKFLSHSLQTGPFGSQLHSDEYITGGTPVINPSHLVGGQIEPEEGVTVDADTKQRIARHELSVGDLVFARRGELGRCAMVTEDEEGWLCGTGSIRLRPDQEKVDPVYLNWICSTRGVAEQFDLKSVGSTMNNLNTDILGALTISLPPLHEQRRIAHHLRKQTSKIDTLTDTVQSGVEQLRGYRTALISAAVTGQIDIREEVDTLATAA